MALQVSMTMEEYNSLKQYKNNYEQLVAHNEKYYAEQLAIEKSKHENELVELKSKVDMIATDVIANKTHSLVYMCNVKTVDMDGPITKYFWAVVPSKSVKTFCRSVKSSFNVLRYLRK